VNERKPEGPNAEQWDRIKRLFGAASELEPARRTDFLGQVCGDDPELRAAVEQLLRSSEPPANFLEPPVNEAAVQLLSARNARRGTTESSHRA
jgi:hypothetical protein